jgi:hypothetical protein
MKRATAKSMALIEATADYFEQVTQAIEQAIASSRNLSGELAKLYRARCAKPPEPTGLDDLIVDAFIDVDTTGITDRVNAFLDAKPFLIDSINDRSSRKLLFRQPSILLVYYLASERAAFLQKVWPLTRSELAPIFNDLGKALDL